MNIDRLRSEFTLVELLGVAGAEVYLRGLVESGVLIVAVLNLLDLPDECDFGSRKKLVRLAQVSRLHELETEYGLTGEVYSLYDSDERSAVFRFPASVDGVLYDIVWERRL